MQQRSGGFILYRLPYGVSVDGFAKTGLRFYPVCRKAPSFMARI